MAYLQSLGAQIALCCRTVGFGFLLGVLYDLVGFLRALVARTRRRFCWDIGYALLAAVCTFLYLLTVNDGKVRLFLLFALTVGFLVWLRGVGRPFRRCTDRLLRCLRRLSAALRLRLRPFFRFPEKCVLRIRTRVKKVAKKYNFLLKLHSRLVYNDKQ